MTTSLDANAPEDSEQASSQEDAATARPLARNSNPRGPRMNPLYKTRICSFYNMGTCRAGLLCGYAHGEDDLRPSPDFGCTSVCAEFLREGVCNKPDCRYAHSNKDLRASPVMLKTKMCSFFMNGDCVVGSACRFAHHANELREAHSVQQAALTNAIAHSSDSPSTTLGSRGPRSRRARRLEFLRPRSPSPPRTALQQPQQQLQHPKVIHLEETLPLPQTSSTRIFDPVCHSGSDYGLFYGVAYPTVACSFVPVVQLPEQFNSMQSSPQLDVQSNLPVPMATVALAPAVEPQSPQGLPPSSLEVAPSQRRRQHGLAPDRTKRHVQKLAGANRQRREVLRFDEALPVDLPRTSNHSVVGNDVEEDVRTQPTPEKDRIVISQDSFSDVDRSDHIETSKQIQWKLGTVRHMLGIGAGVILQESFLRPRFAKRVMIDIEDLSDPCSKDMCCTTDGCASDPENQPLVEVCNPRRSASVASKVVSGRKCKRGFFDFCPRKEQCAKSSCALCSKGRGPSTCVACDCGLKLVAKNTFLTIENQIEDKPEGSRWRSRSL